ncbi:3-carboxy-cis,cis-muconate cycloisomerase [Acidocella sp.]|uniref:3-carboxy-cis,cis-muconate cycloisomerase n=1 Tax=Acidocella sp. TaxID=50710 RepID=UPI003CFE63A7
MTQSFAAALLADAEIETWFSQEAELHAMLEFEIALAQAQAATGLIPAEAAAAIARGGSEFTPDPAALAAGLFKDGVLGPGFVKALRASLPETARPYLHFGATSQDITDTALTLRLKPVMAVLTARLAALTGMLETLADDQGGMTLMAQTRMQAALPMTVKDKVASWLLPLRRHQDRLAALAPRLLVIQLGGPVGTRAELGDKAEQVAAGLAARLALGNAPCWHTARDNIVEFGAVLALIAGALGKIGLDAALLAQTENGSLKIAGGGTSSAMAHKANPVTAELLVALARHAAGLSGTLNQALLHENERSGAAWTLEWFTLPPLTIATGASLRAAAGLVPRMRFQPR